MLLRFVHSAGNGTSKQEPCLMAKENYTVGCCFEALESVCINKKTDGEKKSALLMP